MRRLTHLLISAVLAGILVPLASAAHLPPGLDDGRIVPGYRIGPVALGMSRMVIDSMNLENGCPVIVEYDKSDRAVWLKTEWGGACRVKRDIQVGVGAGAVLATFRMPDAVVEDARYPHATAFWFAYINWGIAFRVLVIRNGSSVIQAIAVFSETASASWCRGAMQECGLPNS